jgi:hypothetical protein
VTGIFDRRSKQFYEVNLATLLHLGAESLYLNKNDPLLGYEKTFFEDDRIRVLGLQTPGLYFVNLLKFDALSKR